jgi:ribosomal-protein-serine acetyltransferase
LQCSIWIDGEICGAIGYHYWDLRNGKTEIGYWLAKNYTGKGIMTKAVRALVDYAFNVLGLHRIEIATAVGNEKSAAIPVRLGFIHEGVIRSGTKQQGEFVDLKMYAILSHEWKA